MLNFGQVVYRRLFTGHSCLLRPTMTLWIVVRVNQNSKNLKFSFAELRETDELMIILYKNIEHICFKSLNFSFRSN